MYKKGIKTADIILRKCPDNGETLAMKGLLLNCLDRKDEAYDHVKRGVKANLRSHVCWHVYGLLYRSDRNYDEAIKCYKNALRMDKDNLTVLRDLTQLQIQMRDMAGHLESRQKLLELKPDNRMSWVGLAMAHHMCGNHEVASTVIESIEDTIEDVTSPSGQYEHGELLLYKSGILEEGGRQLEALAVVASAEKNGMIKDRLSALESRGRLYLACGSNKDAEGVYRKLLNINSENYEYQDGLLAAVRGQGGANDAESIVAVFRQLQELYPHSTAARRRSMDFISGDHPAFEAAADAFVRRYIAKGIPSLFSEFKTLYQDPVKAAALGRVMTRIEQSLASTGAFPEPLQEPVAGQSVHEVAVASDALVWARLYLALHHDRLGNVEQALQLVDECIQQLPTLIELRSARSRILKHAGDVAGAAEEAESARKMDLADRYLNCLAVRALFRAGRVEEAEAVAVLFSRHGDQPSNLHDMQATWYEIASGRAYLAKGDYGRALKRFLKVDAHFSEFVEDQSDFHQYCLRKQTMRAYVDMLRMEDTLYSHPVYGKAAAGAVVAYLALFDNPSGTPEEQESAKIAAMSPGDAKKYLQKKRKQEAKRVKEAAAAAAAAEKAEKAASGGGGKKNQANTAAELLKRKDADPDGVALAATEDPLGEATKLIRRLESAAGDRLETHLLAFEVYLRKGRLLLALRALKRAGAVVATGQDAAAAAAAGSDPQVHYATVRLCNAVVQHQQQQQQQKSESVVDSTAENGGGGDNGGAAGEILEKEIALLGGSDVLKYHDAWTKEHGCTSMLHRLVVAQSTALLHPDQKGAAAAELAKSCAAVSKPSVVHADCVQVHKWLKGEDVVEGGVAADEFAAQCSKMFLYSRYFGGEKCVKIEMGGDDGTVNGVVDGVKELNLKS